MVEPRHKQSVEDDYVIGSGLVQDSGMNSRMSIADGTAMAQAREFEDKLEARMPRAGSNHAANRKYYENPLQVAEIVRAASREPSDNRRTPISPAPRVDAAIVNMSIQMPSRGEDPVRSGTAVRHPNFKRALDHSATSSAPRKASPPQGPPQSMSPASRLKAQHR